MYICICICIYIYNIYIYIFIYLYSPHPASRPEDRYANLVLVINRKTFLVQPEDRYVTTGCSDTSARAHSTAGSGEDSASGSCYGSFLQRSHTPSPCCDCRGQQPRWPQKQGAGWGSRGSNSSSSRSGRRNSGTSKWQNGRNIEEAYEMLAHRMMTTAALVPACSCSIMASSGLERMFRLQQSNYPGGRQYGRTIVQ